MKFLITGANGQLGTEFLKTLSKSGLRFHAFSKKELDVSNLDNVLKVLKQLKPTVVINCSAYNWVDKAENDFDNALSVNTYGPRNLSIACEELKIFLVHYSTDYVFDGNKKGLYNEEDHPNPLNKYALSKLLGEKEIKSLMSDNFLILRVSWVYGEGTQNFLFKLKEWAKTQDFLSIACDEFSVPTSTRTIVEATLKAINKGLVGIYHLVNSGYASRYEWAKEYFKIRKINKLIYPSYQTDFDCPAKRPKWSPMSNKKISNELKFNIKSWEEELKQMIKNISTL